LVLERHEDYGGPSRGGEVDAAVANVPKMPPSALELVGAVEIVAAEDAARAARHRVDVGVVVRGTVRAPWDLIVDDPIAARVAMRSNRALRGWGAFVLVG
jgi:hypothetical protein